MLELDSRLCDIDINTHIFISRNPMTTNISHIIIPLIKIHMFCGNKNIFFCKSSSSSSLNSEGVDETISINCQPNQPTFPCAKNKNYGRTQ